MVSLDDNRRAAGQCHVVNATRPSRAALGQHGARHRHMGWKVAAVGKTSSDEKQHEDGDRQIQLAGDGAVWALTARGPLVRIEPGTFQETSLATFHGRVFISILAAPDGSVWATTGRTLCVLESGKVSNTSGDSNSW